MKFVVKMLLTTYCLDVSSISSLVCRYDQEDYNCKHSSKEQRY